MNESRLRPARRKTLRRWRVPPVLTRGPEVFEGLAVLDEVPGVALWQALRDATLWAEAAPELRPGLFHRAARPAAAAPAPELAAPLAELAALARDPGGRDPGTIAQACRDVAKWAEENGHLATALAFSQASALSDPADAAAALEVARLARRRAEEARAETWYRRTVAVARQCGDWATYSRAFLGLGTLHARRGSLAAARRFHMRAFRAANRNTLHDLEGSALHKLFSLASDAGHRREALRLARTALELYGPAHPRTPRLAHDVARHWLAAGHPSRALAVLRALLPRATEPALRLPVLADLARAAAATGDAHAFMDAWNEAWELAHAASDPPARAFLALARAAASLGAWEKADAAARQAQRAAGDAESLLDSIARRAPAIITPAPEPDDLALTAATLARDLAAALRS
jgi:hypothetical protein